jgi:hypothetical protein
MGVYVSLKMLSVHGANALKAPQILSNPTPAIFFPFFVRSWTVIEILVSP